MISFVVLFISLSFRLERIISSNVFTLLAFIVLLMHLFMLYLAHDHLHLDLFFCDDMKVIRCLLKYWIISFFRTVIETFYLGVSRHKFRSKLQSWLF